jgi:hypothetical protein
MTAPDANTGMAIETVPVGVGATSGRSEGAGTDATSEQLIGNTTASFGTGTGAAASTLGTCWGTSSIICCFQYSQDNFSFVFGSSISQFPWQGMMQPGIGEVAAGGGGGAANRQTCFSLSFYKDQSLYSPQNSSVIDLSLLKSATGTNVNSVLYGYGAGINAAGPGGGGNRLNTAGGNGIVVVIY